MGYQAPDTPVPQMGHSNYMRNHESHQAQQDTKDQGGGSLRRMKGKRRRAGKIKRLQH